MSLSWPSNGPKVTMCWPPQVSCSPLWPHSGHVGSSRRPPRIIGSFAAVEPLTCRKGAVNVARIAGPPTPLPMLAESWLRPECVGIQDACWVRNVKAGRRCYQAVDS